MDVVFAGQSVDLRLPTIFLAGPTPRTADVPSWRPEALDILREIGFGGAVLVPERQDWAVNFSYADQVEWEYAGLESCSVIAFWIPRHLSTLPGFTTNVEFGRYVGSGRCVYGRPDGAPHTSYLDWLYKKVTSSAPHATLKETMATSAFLAGSKCGLQGSE
jgi:hypothetical protein